MSKRGFYSEDSVKSALRPIGVDPEGASKFEYVLGEYVVVDLRLQLGSRGSPGW